MLRTLTFCALLLLQKSRRLLFQVEQNLAVIAVPRTGRLVRKPNALKVEPLVLAVVVITADHLAVRHTAAVAIDRLVRVDREVFRHKRYSCRLQ